MTKEIPKAAAKMAVWKQIAQRPHLQQVLEKSLEEQKKGVHWNLSRLSKVILNQMLLQPRISLMTIKLSKIGLCPKFLLNRKCPCLLSRCHQIFACSVLWLAAVITLPLFFPQNSAASKKSSARSVNRPLPYFPLAKLCKISILSTAFISKLC